MGGIALGNGVMSSGLLKVLDGIIRNLINGYTLYSVVLILSPIVLVGEIFIQHPFWHMSKVKILLLSFSRSFRHSLVTQSPVYCWCLSQKKSVRVFQAITRISLSSLLVSFVLLGWVCLSLAFLIRLRQSFFFSLRLSGAIFAEHLNCHRVFFLSVT